MDLFANLKPIKSGGLPKKTTLGDLWNMDIAELTFYLPGGSVVTMTEEDSIGDMVTLSKQDEKIVMTQVDEDDGVIFYAGKSGSVEIRVAVLE